MSQREWQRANPDKVREYKRRYRERHREEVAAYKREYRERHPEQAEADRERSRAWYAANRDKVRANNARLGEAKRWTNLRGAHGIGEAEFHEMWERQDGRCPICLRDLPREYMTREELHAAPVKPHVDHCHDTGAIRGLLCSTCNQGIGLLREDPDLFGRALVYLSGQFPTITPERSSGVANGDKVKCKYGHPFSEQNTRTERGRRHCRTCDTETARATYRANPKPYACQDCGVPVSKRDSRCRSCAAKVNWAARRATTG